MKELRDQIAAVLSKVTPRTAEEVYKAIQTAEGYKNTEERILEMMAQEGMTISGCIPQLDMQM